MASPPRHRSRATGSERPTRREVLGAGLVAGAAAVLTGCGVRVGSPSARTQPVPPGPEELARERVAKDADMLRALAVRAGALVPADRALLAAVAADHRAHATALRPVAAGSSAGTTAGASARSVTTPATLATPGSSPALTARTALPALVRAERAAAAAATAELDRVSGDVARLLASVAASRSLHARALTARVGARRARAGGRPGDRPGRRPVTGGATSEPSASTAPAGSGSRPPQAVPAAEVSALVAALEAEQAAIYAYGVVGARAGARSKPAAASALQAHTLQRDLLATRVAAAGRRPPAGEPAYALPFEVTSAATARALAAHVESSLAAHYADLVAAAARGRRREAAGWLARAAAGATAWGAPSTPFPGLPERGSS